MNDAPDVVEEFLLFGRAPRAREGVAGVAGEAAGEVSARGRLVRAGHAYLVAVVELRHAARREDEGVREFRASDGRASLAHEAPVVVAADERDQKAGVRVEVILRERLRDLLDVLAFAEGAARGVEKGEVEERIEAGVNAVEASDSSLIKRDVDGVAVFDLAEDSEVRVLAFDCRSPVAPEVVGDVLPGILAYAVNAGRADPPERVLYEIAAHLLVVLIEVGQEIQEPALQRLATALLLGVWVVEHPCLEDVLEVVCARAVVPSGRRAVVNPRVIRARVIANLVLYYFNAELVCVVNEVAQLRERAEVLLDSVEVNRAVAVEARGRCALLLLYLVGVVDVVVPGREPDCCDAQLFEVRQVVDDALEVAAVVVELVRAVVESVRLRRVVVRRVAV